MRDHTYKKVGTNSTFSLLCHLLWICPFLIWKLLWSRSSGCFVPYVHLESSHTTKISRWSLLHSWNQSAASSMSWSLCLWSGSFSLSWVSTSTVESSNTAVLICTASEISLTANLLVANGQRMTRISTTLWKLWMYFTSCLVSRDGPTLCFRQSTQQILSEGRKLRPQLANRYSLSSSSSLVVSSSSTFSLVSSSLSTTRHRSLSCEDSPKRISVG